MTLLEVRGLSRRFDGVQAVEDLSFTVDPGVILGLVGPNGAGKTTTLRILATVDVPTAGEALLDGMSCVTQPERVRPLLGFMPDRYGTYEDLTVAESLDFFARAYGLRGAARRARVDFVLDFVRLRELAAREAATLSKGMRQRLALARTLLHDPKLLLLDEPADGLDPHGRIELRELLRALAEQGKAIIISSHVLSDLAELCQACAVIEKGRLLTLGTLDALMARAGEAEGVELVIRIAADDAGTVARRAEKLLLAQPHVSRVLVEGESVHVWVASAEAGTPGWVDRRGSELLSLLVGAGIPVASLQARRASLEDAFVRLTRGAVS